MVNEIIWTQGSSSDFQEIYNQLTEENAEILVGRVEASLTLLKAFPERAPKFKDSQLRRLLVGHRNRYGIFYSIIGKRIIIAAMVDLTSDPEFVERLLRSKTQS